MKLADTLAEMGSLLDAPSPAVLVLYREDGAALVSPVWFQVHDEAFEVVVAMGDRKLPHLRRDPRCVLLVFETVPPFRGVQVRGRPPSSPMRGRRRAGPSRRVISDPRAAAGMRTWPAARPVW